MDIFLHNRKGTPPSSNYFTFIVVKNQQIMWGFSLSEI